MRKRLGRVTHNKSNALRRCIEKNREINHQESVKSNKKQPMFESINKIEWK